MIKPLQSGFRPRKCVPLWWLAPSPSPHFVVGLWVLSHGAMSLQESIERFILSPGWGGKGTRFVREQSDLRIV